MLRAQLRGWFAFALGMLLALMTGEGCLRLAGLLSPWRQARITPAQSGGIRILCIGNSHTAGFGAAPGEGYPEQLERELKRQLARNDIQVINGGVNNATTSYLVQTLPDLLDKTRPSIVFAMMGEPNGWNPLAFQPKKGERRFTRILSQVALVRLLEHVWHQLQRAASKEPRSTIDFQSMPEMIFPLVERWAGDAHYGSSFVGKALSEEEKKSILAYFDEQLDPKKKETPVDLAVLKARLLVNAFQDEAGALRLMARIMPPQMPRFSFLAYSALRQMREPATIANRKLRNELLHASAKLGPSEALYQKILRWENGREVPPEAIHSEEKWIAFMTDVIKWEPGHSDAYESKAVHLRGLGQYLESVKVLLEAWRSTRHVLRQYSPRTFIVPKSDEERALYPRALALVEAAERESMERLPGRRAFGTLSDEDLAEWIEEDFRAIHRMLKDRHIALVLQTYPPEHAAHFREPDTRALLHGLIRKFAAEEQVPLLDSNEALRAYFSPLPDDERESFYSVPYSNTDDHLNQRGYGVLAGTMAQYLLGNERGLAENFRKP